jgi:serine protease inhibitor
MKNNITGDISYSGINTNRWKSVRIFYENNYALDIIIPQEETKYTNTDKIKMITSLIKSSNNSSCNQDINLTMPLFTFKKKTDITSMLKEMLPNFNKQDIKMEQECIIEVTKAEAITSMFMSFGSLPDIKDITINNGFYYILSELEKIRSGFHTSYNLKNIIMIGAVNNPLVEN